jgi:23S rRNA pseudouridine955/2504/2580 synthase
MKTRVFWSSTSPLASPCMAAAAVSFGVIEALRAARPEETLELVHRIDRDTSGLLMVARKPAALRTLHALMRDGEVEKRYLALVKGKWGARPEAHRRAVAYRHPRGR